MALTNPSDWPESMPDLRTIDNLLRCSICFEYLNVAMVIPSCSHNYCSLCIRRFLKFKQQCPSCNTEVNASQLCNNRTLDELVKAFVAVRPHILKMCKQAAATQDGSPSGDDGRREGTQRINYTKIKKVASTRQSPKETSQNLSGRFNAVQSALAISGDPASLPDPWDDFQISKKVGTSPKEPTKRFLSRGGSRNKSSTLTAEGKTGELSVSTSDDDVIDVDMELPVLSTSNSLVPSQATPSRTHTLPTPSRIQDTPSGSQAIPGASQPTPSCSNSLPTDSQATPCIEDMSSGGQTTPGGSQTTPGGSRDKAECPVCRVPVPTKYINTHLDACLKRSEQAPTNKRVSKRKRIAALVWKLVPDKDLKRKMKEYNLSTKGKRHELVKRLDEFILMYNAQCDAANPKSAEEIAKELERMEQLKAQPQQRKEARVHKLKIDKGDSEDQIQQSQQQYLSAHKDQFSDLIAKTRQRMMAAKKAKKKSGRKGEGQSDQTDSSQDSAASTSSHPPTSSQEDEPKKDPPTTKDSAILQIQEVVILKENDPEDAPKDDPPTTKDSAASTSTHPPTLSQEDKPKKDPPTTKDSAILQLEEVVILKEDDPVDGQTDDPPTTKDSTISEATSMIEPEELQGATSSESDSGRDKELDRTSNLLFCGSGEERTQSEGSDSQDYEMDTSGSALQPNPGLLGESSRIGVNHDSSCRVLVPSSPSVTSKHEHEDNQSQHVQDVPNAAVLSCVDGDLTPDLQDPLCIPESPLSALPKSRLRKRKNQDCASNTSDSGSSFGDGDVMLRRSKRERKTIK